MCWHMTDLVVQLENRRDMGRVGNGIHGASVYFSCTEYLAWTSWTQGNRYNPSDLQLTPVTPFEALKNP